MKSVLISIRPEWCKKIANRDKTTEIRKNKPKLETPFKCYIYCTKGMDIWLAGIKGKRKPQLLNGKVLGEFICDAVYPIQVSENGSIRNWWYYNLSESCLSFYEMAEYIGVGNTGYAWHISNLVIYDKPKELSEFYCRKQLTRPPQSWCYVEHN